MAKKKLPLIEKAEIISVGNDGKAVAKYDGMVIFVPFAAPGDIVDIQIVSKKKSFSEGKIIRFHKYSPFRVNSFCEHFGICGGCSWQHVNYQYQLEFKKQNIADNFQRIGKFEFPTLSEPVSSANITHYRNKLEYTFSNRRWLTDNDMSDLDQKDLNGLGFHIPRLFDKVLDIKTCHLQPEPSNSIRLAVKEYAQQHNYSFYDHRKHTGFLRNLVIRNSSNGEVMVILVVSQNDQEKIHALLDYLAESFSQITSLMYIVNTKLNDSLDDQKVVLYSGNPYITEVMDDLKFRIRPLSFFQTNTTQALRLYQITVEMAALAGNELVYDLYSGTGTIAAFIARQAKEVVGIEYSGSAVADARENAILNNLKNVKFISGDIAKVLNSDFVALHGSPEVVITDPPRAGMHGNVVKALLEINPERIVYVSCNPATQARDIALIANEYKVLRVQPVDMFPHTYHIENIALLEKR
ncbi:MAG: 23S rRNA (uracil(1939)-C(5))-methyltransferase RlmD [Bacteroidales bacterium]|jgi:23S rRNA (uracil1939-C5)-methyltransferase|nr:23S rRNA (uracil(1939)-C(5))-methyltransferase RlmD [Bacteroidales bacterium]